MKLFTLLSTLSLTFSAVHAHPAPSLEERQSNVLLTTGAGGSTIYPRLEVRQMKDTRPNQYTLLVLAMRQWMDKPQADISGYFQIAGIHGVPRIDYNNIHQCQTCSGTDGYCNHNSVHFPAWHRVYMAHFEQEFLKVVKNIANSYPAGQKDTMVAAANQMRFPYFDWAAKPPAGRPTLPLIITDVTVTVNGPNGQTTMTNPLFRFDFKDPSGMYYGPFTTWRRTYRYPNSNDANAASNTGAAVNAFANIRQNLADQLYGLFTNCNQYLGFSNGAAGSSSPQCATSLEGIHNTVHNAAGGLANDQTGVSGGHMTYLPTAAFDPIFWLHHCNVDRLFAMWQRVHPNSYGASQVASQSSWTIAQGSTQNSASPLKPFLKSGIDVFWNTNDVKDWANTFKYTYPEFANSDGSASAINGYINRLYGPNANAVAGSSKRDAQSAGGLLGAVGSAVGSVLENNPLVASNGSKYQYVANVITPTYALNGSYNIFFFNGKPSSEDPTQWMGDKNLIGPMGVFSKPNMTDSKMMTTGQVPLTRFLENVVNAQNSTEDNSSLLGGIVGETLKGLEEALVVPFLTQNLQWRIQGPKSNSIDPGTVEGFVVSIFASTAPQHSDSELPQWSDFISLLDVTKGQAGGANSTQQATSYA